MFSNNAKTRGSLSTVIHSVVMFNHASYLQKRWGITNHSDYVKWHCRLHGFCVEWAYICTYIARMMCENLCSQLSLVNVRMTRLSPNDVSTSIVNTSDSNPCKTLKVWKERRTQVITHEIDAHTWILALRITTEAKARDDNHSSV